MKSIRVALAILTLTVLVGPLAASGRGATFVCPNVQVREAWVTIAAPQFGQGVEAMTAYAVDVNNPKELYATNGTEVYRSANGGCEWERAFSLELLPRLDVPVSVANSEITAIELPEHPGAAGRVYLAIEERIGPLVRPHVAVSKDGGSTWRLQDDGLPLAGGGIYGIHAAPSDPNTIYLHLRSEPATLADEIYVSSNAGSNWRRQGGDNGSQFMGVDPLNPRELWTWGAAGLFHSLDGGASRAYVNRVASGVPIVDIHHTPGSPARIMAYETETQTFSVTKDGGVTWTRIGAPQYFALSMATGASADDVVMSVHEAVFRLSPPAFWLPITPDFPQEDITQMTSDRTAKPTIWGMTPGTIEGYTGLDDEIKLPGFGLDPRTTVDTGTSLRPASTTVRMKVGQSKDVPYEFSLPAHPTPLDVFFLVDTTFSMDSSIAGLRRGMQRIVDSLAESKIDVQFGVGEIKDYPIPGYGDPQAGDFPYRRLRVIGPADQELADAMERLEASGGGRLDYPESQLTGLYQAATGEGDPGFVPPGQDAGFRDDALPVIVTITDNAFHDEAAHPSPDFDRVASELQGQGIRQIGLAVFAAQGYQGQDAAAADLGEMAERTDTIAPAGGVDCDGNGSTDIPEGEPLVCLVSDEESAGVMRLAPAIISTLKAVAEDVDVELATSEPGVTAEVAPGTYRAVDITRKNALDFGVTFNCPTSLAGKTVPVRLAARVDDVPVATASAKVVCRGIPVIKRNPPPKVPPLPVLPAPAPVVAPVVVAPAAPPAVPQTINAPQSAQAVQGAVAPQEQEQLEVAVAVAEFKNDQALAMSAYKERPSPAPLYIAASVMAMGFGGVALARRRVAVKLAKTR